MRGFEKVSKDEFLKTVSTNLDEYDDYKLPVRGTKYSAGYDFFMVNDLVIKAGSSVKIATGVKVFMQPDEMLMIVVRSSMGCKYNIRLKNQVGIVESDYYNNSSNEGQLYVFLQNEGNEDITLKKGDRYVQGIFTKFLTVDDEIEVTNQRTGGFGSTSQM